MTAKNTKELEQQLLVLEKEMVKKGHISDVANQEYQHAKNLWRKVRDELHKLYKAEVSND